ncbi:transmembrane protein 181 [Daktulosphaira vitifoliae]|uniref:transmembrane protein 181 n=1 Tax=Daktulosphaira vitifoliae TaxID=58002 RepID=UPI0021AAF4A0|nr:transmembrane protein 181 [Daktulosphaira vitifoliae]
MNSVEGSETSYSLPTGSCLMIVRSLVSQFNDLFSDFNRYISPAYHHDRCERSVHMRLYSMNKREFIMIFVILLTAMGLVLFIGLTGPSITLTSKVSGIEVLKHTNGTLPQGPYIMKTPSLTVYNQRLWLISVVLTDNKDDEIYDKSFKIGMSIKGVTPQHEYIDVVKTLSQTSRKRHLLCERQTCSQVLIAHIGYIHYTHYIFNVSFYDLETFHKKYQTKEVLFYYKSYNPGYTQMEIWFRLIYLLSTFGVLCYFANSLRKFPVVDWSYEQKWTIILLPLLIFFNNPFFPLTLLTGNEFIGLCDGIFQVTFICAILFFWLCIYHGLRQNERRLITFYLPKAILVSPFWFCGIMIAKYRHINEFDDPAFSYEIDTIAFSNIKLCVNIFTFVYGLYLVCLILRAYSDLRSMPYFDARLKFVSISMAISLLICFIITYMRYGFGLIEDTFAADLNTEYMSSALFMTFYGIFNFYVYSLAAVYSPTKRPGYESSITKDNPAFSMVNDSEEDGPYGSDDECHKPLNPPNDDSD